MYAKPDLYLHAMMPGVFRPGVGWKQESISTTASLECTDRLELQKSRAIIKTNPAKVAWIGDNNIFKVV